MASPFLQAWTVIKSRTNRNQRGALGYGLPAISEQRAGDQTQPFTGLNTRQRVPLVGPVDRVDEFHNEKSDHAGNPSINRRAAEKAGMGRNVKQTMAGLEGDLDETQLAGLNTAEQRAAMAMLPNTVENLIGEHTSDAQPMTMEAMRPDIFQTSEPMEIAFRLLKNSSMDFGDVATETPPAPDPLGEALERARNQPPPQGANLEALEPAGPDPRVSRKYMKDPVQLGLDKYYPPPPPPMTEEDKALLAQLRMGGVPSTGALGSQQPNFNMPPKQPIPIAGTDKGVGPFIHFDTKQHTDGSMHPMG